jgi:hypothetical protein
MDMHESLFYWPVQSYLWRIDQYKWQRIEETSDEIVFLFQSAIYLNFFVCWGLLYKNVLATKEKENTIDFPFAVKTHISSINRIYRIENEKKRYSYLWHYRVSIWIDYHDKESTTWNTCTVPGINFILFSFFLHFIKFSLVLQYSMLMNVLKFLNSFDGIVW